MMDIIDIWKYVAIFRRPFREFFEIIPLDEEKCSTEFQIGIDLAQSDDFGSGEEGL